MSLQRRRRGGIGLELGYCFLNDVGRCRGEAHIGLVLVDVRQDDRHDRHRLRGHDVSGPRVAVGDRGDYECVRGLAVH